LPMTREMGIVNFDWLAKGSVPSGSRRPKAEPKAGDAIAGHLHWGIRAGRAWINGREVGGADARYVHLSNSYD
jgi:hypothetical protein